MKKVYLCEPEKASYGYNDGVVIVADDIDEVIDILAHGEVGSKIFEEEQGNVTITEVDLSNAESMVVLKYNVVG